MSASVRASSGGTPSRMTPVDLQWLSPYLNTISSVYDSWIYSKTYVCTRKYWPKVDMINVVERRIELYLALE
jgi:hypothetical protein